MTASLAWPVATIVLFLFLKKDIGRLLSRISRIKHNDSEIELQKGVEEAVIQADHADLPKLDDDPEKVRLSQLAALSPRGAILDAWLSVEKSMDAYLNRKGILASGDPKHRIDFIKLSDTDFGRIGTGIYDMISTLKRLRNEAVHITDPEVSTETAIEYIKLARRVTAKLEEA